MIPLPVIHIEPAPTAEQIRKGRIADAARARARARREDNRRFGELCYFKFRVIKARMAAHGMTIESYFGPTLLTLAPLERWIGTTHEADTLRRYAFEIPRPYIEACAANPTIGNGPDVVRNPTVVLRFEHASVIATIGDCMAASANKSWGQALAVDPVHPAMDCSGRFILYQYHATSKYNRRIEQRKYLKKRIGKTLRPLVKEAMSDTKKEFLATITPAQASAIRSRLDIDAGEFWRAVKGYSFLPREPEIIQGDLFSQED